MPQHAGRIEHGGLPIRRVLSIICGADLQVVDALRGVYAWTAVVCSEERQTFISGDPLGLVLYGDVKTFSTAEKTRLLRALSDVAAMDPWFRDVNWDAHPFGALGTVDMQPCSRSFLPTQTDAQATKLCLTVS